jgi:hypothetical protein
MTNRVTRIRYGPGRESVEKAELQPVHIQPAGVGERCPSGVIAYTGRVASGLTGQRRVLVAKSTQVGQLRIAERLCASRADSLAAVGIEQSWYPSTD